MNKCKWESKVDSNQSCKRNPYGDSDYCLYHKPDKTETESELFWKIINWDTYSRLNPEEIRRSFELRENDPLLNIINEKLKICELSNFSEKEQNRSDFESYKNTVLQEKKNSNIWVSISSLFDFRGFVFPPTHEKIFKYQYPIFTNSFGRMDFTEAIFKGVIFFDNYTFIGNTSFNNCVFKHEVRFYRAKFLRRASFINVTFSNSSGESGIFNETLFNGNEVIFENIENQKLDFK
ncbi:pentapeptide repeat-containing protein [Marinigracilibium pacificum]|uniref:Pentapeptide repeat protein n=1 Tax=Marinigracilibium pacificum TaxID=2729599 RepID=A0A848J0M4_9BACT|nr:pentapeptide repeat-containing protein [Marinigracilibium pacificum]NMM50343.1 hypothetical protein [Marinigracilibium pacificum]